MRTNSHTTNNNIKPDPLTLVSSLYQVGRPVSELLEDKTHQVLLHKNMES